MQVCKYCNELLPLSRFGKNNARANGVDYKCRPCNRLLRRDYFKTKGGVITDIYSNEVKSSRERNISPPHYTKKELKLWLLSNPLFHTLYEEWVASNYTSSFKPSLDRRDDMLGYSFDNIILCTWGENFARCSLNILNGTNIKTVNTDFSICIDYTGLEVTCSSIREVVELTGLTYDEIWENLDNTYMGFIIHEN